MPELQLRSMLSETETEVSLTQGALAQEWPPVPWPLAQPSPSLSLSLSPTPMPAWAPGRARTPVFAASGVWAATPSVGWIWGKETRERRTPQLQIEPLHIYVWIMYDHTIKTTTTANKTSWLQFRSAFICLWLSVINICLETSGWDYWLKHFKITFSINWFLAICSTLTYT